MDGWCFDGDNAQTSSSSESAYKKKSLHKNIDSDYESSQSYNEGLNFSVQPAAMHPSRQLYPINEELDLKRLFAEDLVQESESRYIQFGRKGSSSSLSSLPALSKGSSETSFLLVNKPSTSSATKKALKGSKTKQTAQSAHKISDPQTTCNQFSASERDDEMLTRAIMAVINSTSSSSSSSSSSSLPLSPSPVHSLLERPPQEAQTQTSRKNDQVGAFKPFHSALAVTHHNFKPSSHCQKMFKMAMASLRRINISCNESPNQESRAPNSNQLHHLISERRRREKLNGSFYELRSLLPPGTKNDKASVLATAKDYLKTLRTEISELEEKNRVLEQQLPTMDGTKKEVGEQRRRLRIQITKASAPASEVQQINLRVTVSVDCDIIELVLHILECLKEMRILTLLSVDANLFSPQMNLYASATIAFEIKACDWNEESFREAMARSVNDVAWSEIATFEAFYAGGWPIDSWSSNSLTMTTRTTTLK